MKLNIPGLKKAIVTGKALLAFVTTFAQAVLPTSWDFDTATPDGWVESLGTGSLRYDQGQAGQACRLDNSGEYVLVSFADEPGQVKYYIKGQAATGGWNGTFVIEESVNGSNFTPMRSLTGTGMPTNTYTLFTDTPGADTRFIRFKYSQKQLGNVALDEVSVLTPAPTNQQEINVTHNGIGIPSGLIAEIGNASNTGFIIQNLGLQQSLAINNITLSGADASQFSLSNIPTSVAANSNHTFNLFFDGIGSGSKSVDITIDNNDANENPYIIHVWAVAGNLATEPSAQASALSFSAVSAWDYNVTISGNSANYYLILRKKGSIPTSSPVDGNTYKKGQWIGDAQVVHSGQAATFNARNIEANTSYYFAAYAYNGSNGFENYLTTNPLANNVTTSSGNSGTTYNNVNPNSNEFVSQLSQAINPGNYNQVYYSNYIGTMINEFYIKDTVQAGQSINAVECQYSGYHTLYPSGFQFTSTGFSREHCYPQSWMPTNANQGFENSHEYSDLQILIPTKQNEVNSVRSNYPYGNVLTPISNYLDATYGFNANNQRVYEPRDKMKGDAARAVMYQAVKYTTAQNDFSLPENISASIPYGQDEYLLKQWHFNDLPDNYEVARNEYVRTKQNNRNPFIDHPQFACYVRFSDMTRWTPEINTNGNLLTAVDPGVNYQWYLDGEAISGATNATYTASSNGNYTVAVQQFAQCPMVGSIITSIVEVKTSTSLKVYPNPSKGDFRMSISCNTPSQINSRILSITGQEVYSEHHLLNSGDNNIDVNASLPKGVYLLEVKSEDFIKTERIAID